MKDVYYIDKFVYSSFLEAKIENEDIYSMFLIPNMNSCSKAENSFENIVSPVTLGYIIYFNSFINSFLFFLEGRYYILGNIDDTFMLRFTESEKEFIKDKAKDYLFSSDYDSNNKFYDIRPLTNNSILVVANKGLLSLLTNNKDEFIEFILSIMSYLDHFFSKSSHLYNRLYLNLKLQDNYFNLLRSRMDLC